MEDAGVILDDEDLDWAAGGRIRKTERIMGNRVYLTKNGHGQIALTNMEELDEMEKELALYKFKLEMEKGERSILEEGTISSEDLKTELGI